MNAVAAPQPLPFSTGGEGRSKVTQQVALQCNRGLEYLLSTDLRRKKIF